jgi:hypothetical protein
MTLDEKLIEEMAMAIYCDSYTQYGTCTLERWKKTSDSQREFCRSQARAVLWLLISKNLIAKY